MFRLTKDSLVVLGILAAGIVVTVLLVYRPQSQEVDRLQTQIASMKTSLADDAQKASVVPTMLRQVEDLRKEFSGWDRQLPTGRDDLGGFLKEISLAQENIVSEEMKPGKPTQEHLYHKLPIIMRFRGSYLALAKFLSRINGMERLTRVNKLVLQPAASGKEGLDVELHLNIYFTES